jgi:hypothetical protein
MSCITCDIVEGKTTTDEVHNSAPVGPPRFPIRTE